MNRSLGLLVVVVLVVIGALLIGLLYGPYAGLLAAILLSAGAGALGLLWLIFTLIGRWVNPDD